MSQRVDIWADRNERRDALDQRLCQWLSESNCLPIPVPNILSATVTSSSNLINWLCAVRPDGILLSGGNDLGDIPERDHTEQCLLVYSSEQALPVLGICRGMQMMATLAGATLIPVTGHVRSMHRLNMAEGAGDLPLEVNSFHNFKLSVCPPDFVAIAHAEDGTIEAIRHQSLPWEGWMWHPERCKRFSGTEIKRLQSIFKVR